MANKEMTRKEALENAIDWIEDGAQGEDAVMIETAAILRKMHAQMTKPRKKSDTPSKARILNESLAAKCYEAMEGQENVTSKWLIEHVNGIMTPQKCTAVMKILVDAGKVAKNKEGKTVTYSRL